MIIYSILVIIIILGAYFGYKKGLVNVLIGFIVIMISIILSLILQNPIATVIRNSKFGTDLYENVYQGINDTIENRKNGIEKESVYSKVVNGIISDEQKQYQSNTIKNFILRGISFIITFIISFVIMYIIKTILNIVVDLPVLRSINKIGGLTFGLLKTLIIIYIILMALDFISKIPMNNLKINDEIEKTNITKAMYNNNVLVKIINRD